MKTSKLNTEHYIWGEQCEGWRLVNHPSLSIIQESMPPGTSEVRHYHQQATQYFYVLSGVATIELDGAVYEVSKHEGLEVPKQIPHQIFNKTDQDIEFLVISQPSTKGDRIEAN